MIDGLGGAFHQADNVAHAEDAAGDAFRVEIIERVELFAGADEFDRRTGDGAHREGGAAAGIAVEPGHDDAGDAERVVEGFGGGDGVLAGHRVDHQQGFHRVDGKADGFDLFHQREVDREAAGGIQDDDVEDFAARGIHGALGDLQRRLAGDDRQRGHLGALGQLFELELGGGALGIEAGEQDFFALAGFQAQRDFAGGGGFAGTLEARP